MRETILQIKVFIGRYQSFHSWRVVTLGIWWLLLSSVMSLFGSPYLLEVHKPSDCGQMHDMRRRLDHAAWPASSSVHSLILNAIGATSIISTSSAFILSRCWCFVDDYVPCIAYVLLVLPIPNIFESWHTEFISSNSVIFRMRPCQ
jgi:hypothetical protein